MYKYMLAVIIIMAIFISPSEARELKSWATKTSTERSWDDSNGYVYAVGTCRFLEDYTEEQFLVYQQEATKSAIKQLKDKLQVEKIVGFQIIDFEYGIEKAESQFHSDENLTGYVVYYVLAAAPKAKNKKKMTSQQAPPPPAERPTTVTPPPTPTPPTNIKKKDKLLGLAYRCIFQGLTENSRNVVVVGSAIILDGNVIAIEISVDTNLKDEYGFYNSYSTLTITVIDADKIIKTVTVQGKAAHINKRRSKENAVIKAAEKAVTKLLE
jgi:hypothetical protein